MSEHQYVAFRAVDSPVSAKNLEYMRRQSSRAEITPWSFENEYHHGDFRGDAVEMLRRGYDIHFHYANFGIRKLFIRIPHGLPDPGAAKPYFAGDTLEFLKDKQGPGGILAIEPFHEPGGLDDLWELDGIIDRLVPLRAEILDGDLRPLYLAHLAVACDENHDPDETREAPVPAGLNALSDAQQGLIELYELSEHLIAAAAQQSPPMPKKMIDTAAEFAEWIRGQQQAMKDKWLASLVADPSSAVRAEIVATFRKGRGGLSWPTVALSRTIAQLRISEAKIAEEAKQKAAAKAASQRAKKLAAMAADPNPTLRETEQLVTERTTDAYRKIAKVLADLREALSATHQSMLAEKQAQKLRAANPTLRMLVSELRRQGFLPK
ncbi:MAG TPA: hypothetical protein VHY91_07645 [Pirellulales bacterium]|jgi:hypothetical protein|nr:hypothetical protein [Pirellulales bacterium]